MRYLTTNLQRALADCGIFAFVVTFGTTIAARASFPRGLQNRLVLERSSARLVEPELRSA